MGILDMIKSALGGGPKVDLGAVLRSGAVVLDVRSKEEFASGHVKGAKHIPLDRLGSHLAELDRSKPIITCCRSGMRSRAAADLLRRQGFDAHNGGPWTSVRALTAR
ncbi:MAG TPA: rhodanese-like domain-containing protein [Flavobacteriales bacterium]|nr:rhodanese-like domain-containing protein [Flavobacteriales bacterium]